MIEIASGIEGLMLPRGYLSYSQMTCWLTNRERFRREYFENGKKLNTKYLTFGKGTAEERSRRTLLPGQVTELKIRVLIRGVPVLSFIDFYDASLHEFEEDKTGKVPWTQAKVQKHEQLAYYATVLKAYFGTMPARCRLNWLETEEGSGDDFWARAEKKLKLTGKTVQFVREFDGREVDRMERLILKSAIEISNAYKLFIREI